MNSKVWYLAAGKKKVGPLSQSRVLRRVAAGKVPAGALAWKDGMDEWVPFEAISEFSLHEGSSVHLDTSLMDREADMDSDSGSDSRSDLASVAEKTPAKKTPAKVSSGAHRSKSRSGTRSKPKKARKSKTAPEAKSVGSKSVGSKSVGSAVGLAKRSTAGKGFSPLHRIERQDVWRSFGLGLSRSRVVLTLAVFGATALGGGVIAGMGALATQLHMLLALPFVLAAGLFVYVSGSLGLGALSFSSRCQLEEREAPTLGEAVAFARGNLGALTLTPFLLSIAWLVPLVALILVTAMVKIPYLGPVGTGLLFGVHLALSAATLFLILTAGIGSLYAPVIVAFEETGVKATFAVLLDFVKRSTARIVFWGALPALAQAPFSAAVIGVAFAIVAPPLLMLLAAAGGPNLARWLTSFGAVEAPIGGLGPGLVLVMIWLGLCMSAVFSVLASVQNAMISLLYLGGREGNDELISRDSYREQAALAEAGA